MKKLLLILMLMPSLVNSITLTVCDPGCDFTSIAAAIAASGATDDIDLQENITEGAILNIFSSNGSTWNETGGASSENFEIQSGLTQTLTLHDLDWTGSAGAIIRWVSAGSGSQVIVEDCTVLPGVDFMRQVATLTTTDQLIIRRNNSVGGARPFIRMQQAGVSTVLVYNNIVRDNTEGNGAIRIDTNSSNSVMRIYNNTFENNLRSIQTVQRGDYKNNLFANNTDDINVSGSADLADFVTNAFEEQTDTGGFGSGNIFGITSTDEFTNEAADDFHLKGGANSRNTGTDLSGTVDDDFDGKPRPLEGTHDIGAELGDKVLRFF